MPTIAFALILIVDLIWYLVIAQVLISWLINFDVLNLRQPLVYQIWSGLNRLLEPIYAPIRSVLPQAGGLDLSPIVVLLGLTVARYAIINNFAY